MQEQQLKFKKESQNKVTWAVRARAKLLEEQSGVEPSLTDTEIQDYLAFVVQEFRNEKK